MNEKLTIEVLTNHCKYLEAKNEQMEEALLVAEVIAEKGQVIESQRDDLLGFIQEKGLMKEYTAHIMNTFGDEK